MRKARRGFGSNRIARIALLGIMGIALSACGDDSGSSGTGAASTTPVAQANPFGPVAGGGTGGGGASTPQPAPAPTPELAPAPAPTASPNVTLAWVPPTQNSDGTALKDLVGYKIHYGTAPADYTGIVAVNNPGLARYVVENLPAGKYYFAVAAYNSKGIESSLSDEVSATLN